MIDTSTITPFETALLGIFRWAEQNSLEDKDYLASSDLSDPDKWLEKAIGIIREDEQSLGVWKQFIRELAKLTPSDLGEPTRDWLLSLIERHA